MSGRAKYDTGTLTRDQIKDMNLAGRNASTGKRYRTSGMTELEKQSKINNWNKLMVKGAIRNLTTVGANTRINNGNYEQYKAALDKLENLLLRQLDEDYKEFKEKVLAKRECAKSVKASIDAVETFTQKAINSKATTYTGLVDKKDN